MSSVYLPEDVLIRRAVDALFEELGAVEAARFLNLARSYAPIRWNGIAAGSKDWMPSRFLTLCLASKQTIIAVPLMNRDSVEL